MNNENKTSRGTRTESATSIYFFLFSRSVNEGKRSVEFRHSTRNTSRIPRKVGNGIVLMGTVALTLGSQVPSAYPAKCDIM